MTELKKLFLETDVDKLMELVEKKKRLSIKDAAASLGETEAVIVDWIKILEEHGYLKISYPIAGSPTIEIGEKKNSESEESGGEPSEFSEENITEERIAETPAEIKYKAKKPENKKYSKKAPGRKKPKSRKIKNKSKNKRSR